MSLSVKNLACALVLCSLAACSGRKAPVHTTFAQPVGDETYIHADAQRTLGGEGDRRLAARFDRAFSARLHEVRSEGPARSAVAVRSEVFRRLRKALTPAPSSGEVSGTFDLIRVGEQQWVLVFTQSAGTRAEWYADVFVSMEPGAPGEGLSLDVFSSVLYAGPRADFAFYADRVWRVIGQAMDRALDAVADDTGAMIRFERAH